MESESVMSVVGQTGEILGETLKLLDGIIGQEVPATACLEEKRDDCALVRLKSELFRAHDLALRIRGQVERIGPFLELVDVDRDTTGRC